MIEVENLGVAASGKQILQHVSFSVEPGRVVGFVGPNGAGKTTTLRALLGLQRVQEGSALIDGKEYGDLDSPIREIGAFIDASWLDPQLTAEKQLHYLAKALELPKTRVQEVLDEVGLGAAAKRRVRNLSLGMKQRLGIATTLMGKPSHFVFDEPINGLDPDGILWFRKLVETLRDRGCAVLLSSHVMSELQAIVDDVVVIRSGEVLTAAPIEQLEGKVASRVHVRGEKLSDLVEFLTINENYSDIGIEFRDTDDLMVSEIDTKTVFIAAVESGAIITHLSNESISLEDHYRRLVNN